LGLLAWKAPAQLVIQYFVTLEQTDGRDVVGEAAAKSDESRCEKAEGNFGKVRPT
jgi:hypothetical protein